MAFARVTLGLFLENSILFDASSFARIAYNTLWVAALSSSVTGGTQGVPLYLDLFDCASFLHYLFKTHFNIDSQVPPIKQSATTVLCCSTVFSSVCAVLPRGEELFIGKRVIFLKPSLASFLAASFSFRLLFFTQLLLVLILRVPEPRNALNLRIVIVESLAWLRVR